jgi:hypothetical protein
MRHQKLEYARLKLHTAYNWYITIIHSAQWYQTREIVSIHCKHRDAALRDLDMRPNAKAMNGVTQSTQDCLVASPRQVPPSVMDT